MTTEKDQLIKKILSEQKDRLVHFLECCRIGEMGCQLDQIDEKQVLDAIERVDVINEFLYSKNLLKSIAPQYQELLKDIRDFEAKYAAKN